MRFTNVVIEPFGSWRTWQSLRMRFGTTSASQGKHTKCRVVFLRRWGAL